MKRGGINSGNLTPLEIQVIETLLDERYRQRRTRADIVAGGSLSASTVSAVEKRQRRASLLFAEEYARILGKKVKIEFVELDEAP